jgi:hypothetical protein
MKKLIKDYLTNFGETLNSIYLLEFDAQLRLDFLTSGEHSGGSDPVPGV